MADKQRILESERYKDKRDLIMALLDDGVEYTTKDVDRLIKNYEKKEVV